MYPRSPQMVTEGFMGKNFVSLYGVAPRFQQNRGSKREKLYFYTDLFAISLELYRTIIAPERFFQDVGQGFCKTIFQAELLQENVGIVFVQTVVKFVFVCPIHQFARITIIDPGKIDAPVLDTKGQTSVVRFEELVFVVTDVK